MVSMGYRDGKFKQYLIPLLNQDGVFDHGRVNHRQLAKEMLSSGFFTYPCSFEEISCISVMKAQACGAIPITTDYAALAETNKYGIQVAGKAGDGDTNERFKDTLIKALNGEFQSKRLEMMENRTEWGWDKVAREWSALMS
jgi:glycosyltransferase involved in cell wall biosynthesis